MKPYEPVLRLRRTAQVRRPLPSKTNNAVYIKDIEIGGLFYITDNSDYFRLCFVKVSKRGAQVNTLYSFSSSSCADQVFPDDFPLYRT